MDDRDDRARLGTSFAGVADVYDRARPDYPLDAVRWLVGTETSDVVDVGAGTGKLTRTLVALGHRVTAVEPLEEMLAQLRRAVPAENAVVGGAEALPLADASADVVTCAQAFHWFDHDRALDEFARVLRPGGHLALVWNTRDERVAWVAELSKAIGAEDTSGTVEDLVATRVGTSFGPVEHASFEHVQRLTRQSLRDLVLSRSCCAVRTPEEREPVLAAVDTLFKEHAEGGEIALPYATECFRAERL